MPTVKKAAISDYATPPFKLEEGPFSLVDTAAQLRELRFHPRSRTELRQLANRLNAVTIWYWFARDNAAAPTSKMVLDTVGSLERYSGKLLKVMHSSEPSAWTDLDDFSPEVSRALVGLLRDELQQRVDKRLASARHAGGQCDLTIGIIDIFGTSDLAEMLRLFIEVLLVLHDTSKHLRQNASDAPCKPDVRPESGFIDDLRKIYREVLGRTPRRGTDRITGRPCGQWFAFVKFCCRTAGIDASDQTIDGWLKGR
jgi:hypothetical protein